MKLDRLMMWRFADSPKALRSLHRGPGTPEWLVFIPRALSGIDLDEAILLPAEPGKVARYETPKGVVYIGSTQLAGLPDSRRLSAMSATHSRRK